MTLQRSTIKNTEYRGWEIVPEFVYAGGEIDAFAYESSNPEKAMQFHYSNLNSIKRSIDENIFESTKHYRVETTIHLGDFKLRNITKFTWLSEAVQFASKFNGVMSVNFNAM